MLLEGFLFIVILFIGLAYVWAKGDLDWVMSYSGSTYQPPERRARIVLPKVTEIVAAREAEKEAEKEAADGKEGDSSPDESEVA